MFGPKLKLTPELMKKLQVAAQIAGASSVEEFALKILEDGAEQILASTAKKDLSAAEVEDIANQLKGLGYIE